MSEPVTLTCKNDHTFTSSVRPGGRTDCTQCRREGLGRVVVRRPVSNRVLQPLPGPEDFTDDGFEADETLDSGLPADLEAEIAAAEAEEADTEPEPAVARDEPEPAHPLPGFLREPGKRTRKAPQPKIRLTAAVRKDVESKIRFVLVPAGRLWQIRDVPCGSTFVEQEPEISSALAEIVCDSPDLLAWFTGPAGGFMKYFRLVMAVQPVALMLYAHHIAHAVEEVPADWNGQATPDYSAYPA